MKKQKNNKSIFLIMQDQLELYVPWLPTMSTQWQRRRWRHTTLVLTMFKGQLFQIQGNQIIQNQTSVYNVFGFVTITFIVLAMKMSE